MHFTVDFFFLFWYTERVEKMRKDFYCMSKKKRRNAPHRAGNGNNKKTAKKNASFEMQSWMRIALIAVAVLVVAGIVFLALPRTQYAYIEIENYGTIEVELYDEVAPITVKNFVKLAKNGFYDGLTFHRIIKGFMMQGGCPKGDGTGGQTDRNGKEINIKGEFSVNGVQNNLSHTRGVISMARSADPYYDSASSQFFIMHETNTSLDGKYAAFGRVLKGMEIVDKICEDVPQGENGKVLSEDQPVIKTIRIKTRIG